MLSEVLMKKKAPRIDGESALGFYNYRHRNFHGLNAMPEVTCLLEKAISDVCTLAVIGEP